ncbi:MAG: rhodanese-like domain-containing protein, partial [Tumebacillaceae bacterium]
AYDADTVFVVYCWGPACNGATKAAARLSELGYRVKEMLGGIEYWRKEGNPVAGALGEKAPLIG